MGKSSYVAYSILDIFFLLYWFRLQLNFDRQIYTHSIRYDSNTIESNEMAQTLFVYILFRNGIQHF